MATITLEYDGRSNTIKKALELVIALGAKVQAPAKKRCEAELAIQEVKEGKLNSYKSSQELFRKLGI